MSDEELRAMARVVRMHLGQGDLVTVARALADAATLKRFATLLAAYMGQSFTDPEWAALVLRVAKRALAGGGPN